MIRTNICGQMKGTWGRSDESETEKYKVGRQRDDANQHTLLPERVRDGKHKGMKGRSKMGESAGETVPHHVETRQTEQQSRSLAEISQIT